MRAELEPILRAELKPRVRAELETGVRRALLVELLPQINAIIEERLKQDLAPLVETMFDELRSRLQMIGRGILDEAIQTALSQDNERRG